MGDGERSDGGEAAAETAGTGAAFDLSKKCEPNRHTSTTPAAPTITRSTRFCEGRRTPGPETPGIWGISALKRSDGTGFAIKVLNCAGRQPISANGISAGPDLVLQVRL